MAGDRVDLMRLLCRALDLDDHGFLAPDLSRATGGGWISRRGAARLAALLEEASDSSTCAEERNRGRTVGYAAGYEAGWSACLLLCVRSRPAQTLLQRAMRWAASVAGGEA